MSLDLDRYPTLKIQIYGLPRYYQGLLNLDSEHEEWQLAFEIANSMLEIVEAETFSPDSVDILYTRFIGVEDQIGGSASFDLRSAIKGLKEIVDSKRKQE